MSSGLILPAALDRASPDRPASDAPLAAFIKDIHPGPPLIEPQLLEQSLDPRVAALLWVLIIGLLLLLFALLTRKLLDYRRWCQQLEGDPQQLVMRIQQALRHAALQRWPEARQLQGAPWLDFIDRHGGSNFSQFAHHWNGWLYGDQHPTHQQCQQLGQAYRRWGYTLFWHSAFRRRGRPPRRQP